MNDEWEWQQNGEKQPQVHMQDESLLVRVAHEHSFSLSSANMPTLLTSFVGREKEYEIARTLLLRPEVRLLTFSGAGGIGKTRLAVAVINDLRSYFVDGVYFVPLAACTNALQVLLTITSALGIQNGKEQPLLDLLIANLHEKQLVLLLDNFEHVLEAAMDVVALLKACPRLKIVVTSRAVLRVQGEYEFAVPPLNLPDLKHLPPSDQLSLYPSIALFVQRAQAAKYDFVPDEQNAATLAAICVRLDGLPLAIELAAPRLKLMSPQDLLRRLEHSLQVLTDGSRDLDVRQQTLRNTVKWSYDILSDDEKRLFRRLSVFGCSFTVEAAEAICQIDHDLSFSVLDGLTALLNKSLIYRVDLPGGEPYLLMMETIRDYGLECLAADKEEEATIRNQHADHFLRWMEIIESRLYGSYQLSALGQVEHELNNLRQALRWFIEHEEYEKALRLAGATGLFWSLQGYLLIHEYFREGQRFLGSVLPFLDQTDQRISEQARAKVLLHYGILLDYLEDREQAEMFGRRSLALYRQLALLRGCMQACWLLESCARRKNAYTEASAFAEEALQFADRLNDDFARGLSLNCLGLSAFYMADYTSAYQHFETCLLLVRKMQNPFSLVQTYRRLAEVVYAQGDYQKARQFCEESLALSRSSNTSWNVAWLLTMMAGIVWRQGDVGGALQYAQDALADHTTVGEVQGIVHATLWLARISAHLQQTELAHTLSAHVVATIKDERDRWFCAVFLSLLAEVAVLLKELRWAALLWRKATALREEIRAPLSPTEMVDYEATHILLRKHLGEAALAALSAEGARLSVAQVLDLRETALNSDVLELLPSSKSGPLALEGALSSLTRRELEVLRLLAMGKSNAQIAELLTISRVTVNSYLRAIYTKLSVSSRTAAMRYAIDHHLLS